MINPYSPTRLAYKPIKSPAQQTQLNHEQKVVIGKTAALYGSSFLVGTVVGTVFGLTKNLNFRKIMLGALVTTAPIGLAILEGAKLFYPTNKQN